MLREFEKVLIVREGGRVEVLSQYISVD
jgi:hypothetical protein